MLVSGSVAVQNVRAIPFILVGLFAASVHAADFYVSPTGTPRGNGSLKNPWDLQTALNQPPVVHPGDTIWLRGGEYRPASSSSTGFTSTLGGGSNRNLLEPQ